MTSISDVEKALVEIGDYKNAKQWVKNDIIKIKIAHGYDDWIKDIEDHKLFLSLVEYIESLLDTSEYFEQ